MSRLNSGKNSKTGYSKYITIDLTFSYDCFNNTFQKFQKHRKTIKSQSLRISLTTEEMTQVLGEDWNILVEKNTTTRQRIIDDITVQHRTKFTSIYDNTNCPR